MIGLTTYTGEQESIITHNYSLGNQIGLHQYIIEQFVQNPLNIDIDYQEDFFEIGKDISFSFIHFNEYYFQLKQELKCKTAYDSGIFYIKCSILKITGAGYTTQEAIESFNFNFYALYKTFAKEVDENLSPQALQLKNKINSLILFKFE